MNIRGTMNDALRAWGNVWPRVRLMFVVLGVFSLVYALLSAWDLSPRTFLHAGPAKIDSREYNLLHRTTQELLSYFDEDIGRQLNVDEGLMSFGPHVYLPAGEYSLHFDFVPLSVDEDEPYITIDVYRSQLNKETQWIVSQHVVDVREFHKDPNLTFVTDGGVGHEFVIHVSSDKTRIALDDLKLTQLDESEGYWIWLSVSLVLLLLGTFIVHRLLSVRMGWRQHAVTVLLIACVGYAWLAYQESQPVIDIAMTGDSPNYLVLADYIAREGDLLIESTQDVYDPAKYSDLIGFTIFDPPTHMHELDGRVFPHHQFGYSLLLAGVLKLHRSVDAAVAISILAIALGLVFIHLSLTTRVERFPAAVVTVLVGASSPLVFYSHTVFTETLAFAVVAASLWYVLIRRDKPVGAIICAVLLGALLFLKFKYIFVAAPIVGAAWLIHGRSRITVAQVAILFIALLLYEVHTYSFTGSWGPFSWYGATAATQIPLWLRIVRGGEVFLSYFFDQRYGIFLVAPFTILLVWYGRELVRKLVIDRLVLAVTAIMVFYLGMYALSGSWGGTGPALRPHMAVWPLLVYVVFTIVPDIKRMSVAFLLSLSVLFSSLTLITSTQINHYTNNYSKFYETVSPYNLRLHETLPNFSITREKHY